MTVVENEILRPLAASVLSRRAGSAADAAAVAAATRGTYKDLAEVLVPLIGEVGVDALTTRALHLAQRGYPAVPAREIELDSQPITQLGAWLEAQDPVLARDAGAAVLGALGGLLVTFIGEPLTMRLFQKAWPDAFHEASEETET